MIVCFSWALGTLPFDQSGMSRSAMKSRVRPLLLATFTMLASERTFTSAEAREELAELLQEKP